VVLRSSRLATRQTATFVKNPLPQAFSAEIWSPDGKLIAGSLLGADGAPRAIALWDVANGNVRALNVPLPSAAPFFYVVAGWLPDSRRFLAFVGDEIAIVDSVSGQSTPVQARAGYRYHLVGGGRTLMVERLLYDADVWLMEIKR